MKPSIHIVKIGGKIINDPGLLDQVLEEFCKISGHKILIHGGGRKATALADSLGIETKMIEGRRVTDIDTLDVVIMTYAGLINKNIVAKLQNMACNSLGLSGADFDIMRSKKRNHPHIDYGYVGDIVSVNARAISSLLKNDVVPVICSITHDGEGQLLNTNADTIASKMAIALSKEYEVKLKFCFEYSGVLKDIKNDKEAIPIISQKNVLQLKHQDIIHAGMVPKIDNALVAKTEGVFEVSICGIDNLIHQKNATWIH